MSRYNDPAHLPLPLERRERSDEDEAFDRWREREDDRDDEADNG